MYKSSILPAKNIPTSLNNVSSINQSYCAVYNRNYLILKSQFTVLENLQPRIEHPPLNMTWEDKQKLSFIGYLIESLKEIKFGHIFRAADTTIASIRSLLEPPNIHPENEKLLNTLMNATLTINQICNTLNAIFSGAQMNEIDTFGSLDGDNEIINDQITPNPIPKSNIELSNNDNYGNEFIVCRICEEKIPASLIEAHTESCLTRYRSETEIKNINDHLRKIQKHLNDVYLEVPWPGPPKEAVDVLFPVLHLMILLERARNLDPHISDTIDELIFIQSVIQSFIASDSMKNVPTISGISKSGKKYKPKSSQVFLDESVKLIGEKTKTSNALNNALLVSRQTRVSSNNDSFYDKNFGRGDGAIEKKTTIADFNFIKRISKGAYASVFLATKKTTGDIFAIKVTPKSSLKQKNQVRRILNEKDILLQFSNPFIVTFYYSIIGENNLYLVTEFIPGGDLYSLLQNVGSLEEQSAKLYSLQVLYALRYLRQNGIIHRDIKPDNILITSTGRLKLTDFGLSYMGMVDRHINQTQSTLNSQTVKIQPSSFVFDSEFESPPQSTESTRRPSIEIPNIFNGQPTETNKKTTLITKNPANNKPPVPNRNHQPLMSKNGSLKKIRPIDEISVKDASSLVGTPDYVAPEIILNQSHTFTVDYWSLGVMIYEMLYGIPPFHGDNERETHRNILVGHVDFSDPSIELSPEAIDLIKHLLIIEPTQRLGYNDIDEIINHPWFKGVDPLNDTPPFVPDLSNAFDTGYFEQRYEFDGNEDASILIDLQNCIEPTTLFPDDDISTFPSVALDQLGNANREIAGKIFEKHHSANFVDEDRKKKNEKDSQLAEPVNLSAPVFDKPHRRSVSLSNDLGFEDVSDTVPSSISFSGDPMKANDDNLKPIVRSSRKKHRRQRHRSLSRRSSSSFIESDSKNSEKDSK